MPVIPVDTNSPITATKAKGVTPQTATPEEVVSNSQYTPAGTGPGTEPGTTQASPTPTRTAPLHDGPPPPQPGAVPRLPTATTTTTSPAGPSTRTSQYQPQQAPEPTAAPHYPGISQPPQMSMPAPGMSYEAGQRGTAIATGPPGYQQNSSLDQYQSAQARNDSHRGGNDAEDEGVWGSAVKWAQAAGKKLSEAESEVWKRINKE